MTIKNIWHIYFKFYKMLKHSLLKNGVEMNIILFSYFFQLKGSMHKRANPS